MIYPDLARLEEYLVFRINIRRRAADGKSTRNEHFIAPMKHCNVSEFEEIGVKMDDYDKGLVS